MVHTPWITELFLTIDRRDAAGFAGFLADDGVFRFGNEPEVRGARAVEAYVASFFDGLAAISHRLVRRWEHPASVVVEGEVTYTRRDQRQITLPFVNVLSMRDHKIADYRIYVDVAPLHLPAAAA